MVMDPELDTSRKRATISFTLSRRLGRELNEWQLVDPWRIANPTVRDYSVYSNAHNMYSRLDYFLVRHGDLAKVKEVSIDNISVSDHAPVNLVISLSRTTPKRGNWRLNESLLNDKVFFEQVRRELELFFELNRTPEISPMIVWETHKVFIRGILIK